MRAVLLTSVLIAGPSSRALADPAGSWWPVPTSTPSPPAPQPDIPARQGHTIVYDSTHHRFLAFGGIFQPGGGRFNDVWERLEGATGPWTPVTTSGTPPSPRSEHTAVYDPAGDRLLVFGGDDGSLRNDVWQLSLAGTPTWSLLTPSGTPPAPRSGHTMVLDAARKRLVVFGGRTPTVMNDLWVLDLTVSPPAWQELSPSGTLPTARAGSTAIFDAGHDRMVMYGGLGSFNWFSDLWTLSFTSGPAWLRRGVFSTPDPRDAASSVYDPAHGRMLVLGGRYAGSELASFFSFDLTTFAYSSLTGTGLAQSGRFLAGMAISPSQLIVHGGGKLAASLDDTWQFVESPLPFWGRLWPLPSPPPPVTAAHRYAAAGVYDGLRDRFLMFGGAFGSGPTILQDIQQLQIGRDSSWVSVMDPAPYGARFGHSAIYDPVRDRVVLFGGYSGVYRNDLWQITLPSFGISQFGAAGTLPVPRDYFACIYDPLRDRMIVYGGNNGTAQGDVWALNFGSFPATWVQLSPTGTPPPARMLHSAIYDPYGDRMITFGGFDGTGSRNDLWALNLSGTPSWTQLVPSGTPPGARYGYVMQLDPNRQRVVLYGGKDYASNHDFDDVWELPLGGQPLAWTPRPPVSFFAPPGRYVPLGLIDPIHDRLLVSGGASVGGDLGDIWRLQWSNDNPTATEIALLSSDVQNDEVVLKWGLSGDAATYARLERRDASSDWRTIESGPVSGSFATFHDHEVVAGGRYAYRLTAIAGASMSTSSEVWIDVPVGPSFSLAGFSPNPATREARVAFSLAERTAATIEVVDVGGRRVVSQRIDAPTPGIQSIAIAPAGGLSPGLYFVKLTQGGRRLRTRGTVMR